MPSLLKNPFLYFPLLLLITITIGGCTLPSLDNREVSLSMPKSDAEKTQLGAAILPLVQAHQGMAGIKLLGNPRDAFATRVLLAKSAQSTLDLQYYIWEKDVTGTLMLEAIIDAANRGVRVRLLLDDNGIAGLDEALSAINRHENAQVRLFNPFVQRKLKWLGYVTDFSRVNRRMHNKSFTVDNSVTVIGGRNIGDDYFGATSGILKQDLDLLAIGSVVNDLSNDFDKYWSSASAYPIENIVSAEQKTTYSTAEYIPEHVNSVERDSYIKALQESIYVQALLNHDLTFDWSTTQMISDDPAKGVGKSSEDHLLINKLTKIIGKPQSSLLLVSPYFVPTKAGVAAFIALANQGVSISVLTNSMQATDVLPVHTGYAKHRKELLNAGIKLFELRPSANQKNSTIKKLGPFGSSASSLHAKTFAIDSDRLFVGSFNFDPRSMHLNTELGFIIDSAILTSQVETEFDQKVHDSCYQVKLNDEDKLIWIEKNGDTSITHVSEPGMSIGSRMALSILSVLPIEWLL